MKIKKFEDLESWKKSRKLTNRIYEATGTGRFTRDFGLKDQIRRASISILSNIAEGFERGGDKEFLQFLAVAKGSVARFAHNSTLLWLKGIYRRPCLRDCLTRQMKLAA
jgi:four helix bundle protein